MTVRNAALLVLALFLGFSSTQLIGCGGSDEDPASKTAKPLVKKTPPPLPNGEVPPVTAEEHAQYKSEFSWKGEGAATDVGTDYDQCLSVAGEPSSNYAERLQQSLVVIACMDERGWMFRDGKV